MKKKTVNSILGKRYDGMMGRCYREKDICYKTHMARGIRVCSSWIENIDNFKSWALEHLKENNISDSEFITNSRKYSLDRIDVNGHYTPSNCRLVPPQTQSRNKRGLLKKIISSEGNEHEFFSTEKKSKNLGN